MFPFFSQLYPQDFVDIFISNKYRFLDDVFHKCLGNFDIKPFYETTHNLDPNLKLIFKIPA